MKLSSHKTIGLDMDGTLVPDKRTDHLRLQKNEMLREWIDNNRDNHKFIVVTFRDYSWAQKIPHELKTYGLDPSFISEIFACPVKYWEAYHMHKVYHDESPAAVEGYNRYIEWKGFICKEEGASILIDDMPDSVLPGCKKYGINFVDIKDFDPT